MILFLILLIERPVEPQSNFKIKKNEQREFNTLKFLFKSAIKIYQFTLSGMQGDVCNFEPSCSNYAMEAIEKYGPLTGILLAADRLERCNPFAFSYVKKYYRLTYVKGRGIKIAEKPEEVMKHLTH